MKRIVIRVPIIIMYLFILYQKEVFFLCRLSDEKSKSVVLL